MRTKISTNQTWKRYIFSVIGIIALYYIFNELVHNVSLENPELHMALVITGLSYCGYNYFSKRKDLAFDSDFLYIREGKEEQQVPLKHITMIKLTMTKLSNRNTWKIYHLTSEGKVQNIRMLPPKKSPERFETFKAYTKQINPDLIIDNKARTF